MWTRDDAALKINPVDTERETVMMTASVNKVSSTCLQIINASLIMHQPVKCKEQ